MLFIEYDVDDRGVIELVALINAVGLGEAVAIPPDMRAAALQRAMSFEQRGTTSA